ncbi:MAG: reverse transcriptase family protein, partial [Muribaculaceae bacterium]|nr:reverse transcriptase family protein [Muribaculaceae bacterium]
MNKLELARPYLVEEIYNQPKTLAKALSICGAVLGFWGLNGLSQRKIRQFLTKRAREKAYIEFEIPKKYGGTRRISSPNSQLKRIQQCINLMLQTLCEVSQEATGFVPDRSIVTNAEKHLDSSVIFNCDLKDFFPSITKEMVRKSLAEELQNYQVSREVVNMLSSLVTAPRKDGVEALPQGAPTSPVVSNLVLKKLDRRLSIFAEKNGYRYSRYADDITFSKAGDYNAAMPIKSGAIESII